MAENQPSERNWERNVLEKLAFEALAEQRRRRRWGIFFKILGLTYVALFIVLFVDWGDSAGKLTDGKRHSAMVQVNGVIQGKSEASAERIVNALKNAFEDKSTQGVILRINSPGGSPVQAGIIFDEIRRLRQKHPETPLYAVVEDVCASGGYYIAAATDQIYVDKASVVGSIGVLMDGFGFTETMQKLGIERRLLTAGENKGFLDPFSPQEPKHREHAQLLLNDIHRQFIEVVRKGRGTRLKEVPELFTGLMWTGSQSIELGLADGLGNVDYVAREVIKAEDIRDFTVKQSFAERFAQRFGTDMADSLARSLTRFSVR